jgi:hypothetical protein
MTKAHTTAPNLRYLFAPPLCSARLLRSIDTEHRRRPPRLPPWSHFSAHADMALTHANSLRAVITPTSVFLSPRDMQAVTCLARCFSKGVLFADAPIHPPWPLMHSRLFGLCSTQSPLPLPDLSSLLGLPRTGGALQSLHGLPNHDGLC